MPSLSALDQLESYQVLFTDAAFWAPYVREVCRRHNLSPVEPIRTGIPGTYPTFIVAERWVVKFFGRLFEGAWDFAVEREAARLVGQDPAIPIAKIIAEGELGQERSGTEWPWPYLVFDSIPGTSIGEAAGEISDEDRLRAARELGGTIRRLHALPLDSSPVFDPTRQSYLRLLEKQREQVTTRHHKWGSLPARLVEQIGAFLPPLDELVDWARPPHLIHADLTRDHLLGRTQDGHWSSLAVIDFGDAMTGDLLYELAALHLDLFGSDRRLLAAFLAAYGLDPAERARLPRRALATALLHRFNVFFAVPPAILQAGSLEELAERLWDVPDI